MGRPQADATSGTPHNVHPRRLTMQTAFECLHGIAPRGFGVRWHNGKAQVYISQTEILAEGPDWDTVVGILLEKKER